jgi:hypothetical protein
MSHPEPVGLYEPFVRVGRLVALSAISTARDGVLITGKVGQGRDLDLAAGQAAVRRAAENLLSVLCEAAAADFDNVERLALVRGYLATAIRAVEAVNDPALQAARTMCLANLRQAQSQIGS